MKPAASFFLLSIWLAAAPLTGGTLPGGERYTNVDYAFTVQIPAAAVAETEEPPSPNHGFGVTLPDRPAVSGWVAAHYDATLLESLEAVLGDAMTGALQRSEEVCFRRFAAQLDTLPAVGLVAAEEGGAVTVKVLALRELPGEVGIIYTVAARATDGDEAAARQLVDQLVGSFALLPPP